MEHEILNLCNKIVDRILLSVMCSVFPFVRSFNVIYVLSKLYKKQKTKEKSKRREEEEES